MLSMPRIVRPNPFSELVPPLIRTRGIIKRNKELLEI
jgi:hypothetical protein